MFVSPLRVASDSIRYINAHRAQRQARKMPGPRPVVRNFVAASASQTSLRRTRMRCRSPLDTSDDKSFGLKRRSDLGDLVALDFDGPILYRASGATGRT